VRLPGRWWVVLPVAAALLLAVLVVRHGADSDSSARAVSGVAAGRAEDRETTEKTPAAAGLSTEGRSYRRWVARVLGSAVDASARREGGTVQAAVMLDRWPQPIAAASEPGAVQRPMRMWSIAKVVTSVAVLRELGWGNRRGKPLSPQLAAAMRGALVRSENCRQRRLVLGLQELTGGPAGAQAALADVLAEAGADADLDVAVEAPEPICEGYLSTQEGSIPDPYAPTLLLGTATWRITDLAAFLQALGSGAYGEAIEQRLLSLMREPKAASTEVPREEFSADLAWGAGNALAGVDPAYKAGWGGTLQGAFMAAQGAVIELEDGRTIAFSVAFHPDQQPPKDDPGLTEAPAAIEQVFGAFAAELFAR